MCCFPAIMHGANWIQDYKLKGGVGYRVDHLDWNIADTSGHPNVLSELEWGCVYMAQFSLQFEATLCPQIYLKARGDYGTIAHGTNTDKDYGKDNRQSLFSYSRNKAGRGYAYDGWGGIGYVLNFPCIRFIPLGGYSTHKLALRQFDGFQVFYIGRKNPFDPHSPDFSGPIEGLNSSYTARFQGPWAGADLHWDWCNFHYFMGFEYHWADYRALGDWNLRKEFANDFIHSGKAHGQLYRIGVDCDLTCGWGMGVLLTYQNWKLKNGTDRTFFFNFDTNPIPPGGEVPIIVGKTRLNQVNWNSFLIELNVFYDF